MSSGKWRQFGLGLNVLTQISKAYVMYVTLVGLFVILHGR